MMKYGPSLNTCSRSYFSSHPFPLLCTHAHPARAISFSVRGRTKMGAEDCFCYINLPFAFSSPCYFPSPFLVSLPLLFAPRHNEIRQPENREGKGGARRGGGKGARLFIFFLSPFFCAMTPLRSPFPSPHSFAVLLSPGEPQTQKGKERRN